MTKDDYERIKNNARLKGFYSTSGFLRHLALDHDFITTQKINEIHTHLLGDKLKGRFKKNSIPM